MSNLQKKLKEMKEQGKTLHYMISYIVLERNGDELDALRELIQAGYTEREVLHMLEKDFAFDMSEYQKDCTYEIYQLRADEVGERLCFKDRAYLEKYGIELRCSDYDKVYRGLLENQSVEDIYIKFNIEHPIDFKGHSLSVSDVVVLRTPNNVNAYFIDSKGYVELENFFEKRDGDLTLPKEDEGKTLVYKSECIGDRTVSLCINQYADNGAIYVGLMDCDEGVPFGDVTVNLAGKVSEFYGYLDTNNLSDLCSFIENNGLGEFAGKIGVSGYCRYPLYKFNREKLKEFCPDGLAQYEANLKNERFEKNQEV